MFSSSLTEIIASQCTYLNRSTSCNYCQIKEPNGKKNSPPFRNPSKYDHPYVVHVNSFNRWTITVV